MGTFILKLSSLMGGGGGSEFFSVSAAVCIDGLDASSTFFRRALFLCEKVTFCSHPRTKGKKPLQSLAFYGKKFPASSIASPQQRESDWIVSNLLAST